MIFTDTHSNYKVKAEYCGEWHDISKSVRMKIHPN